MKHDDYKTLTSLDREVLEVRDSPAWDDLSDEDKIEILANRLHWAGENWSDACSDIARCRESGWDCAQRVAVLESFRGEVYAIAGAACVLAVVAGILAATALWGAA